MKKVIQHFVPKFYLRYFSIQNNRKQIGLYNLKSEILIWKAALKFQAYKTNFYGEDGELEEALSEIEDKTAILWDKIVKEFKLPEKYSKEYDLLLLFIVVLKHRNPYAVQEINDLIDSQIRSILKIANPEGFDDNIHYGHRTPVDVSFSRIFENIEYLQDLDYKLIINKTNIPFITSDNPVVFYNSFLESKRYPLACTGYASLGLQIFLPLNPKIVLLIYDKNIYKVERSSAKIVNNILETDVQQMNLLQVVNSITNIYFNEQFNDEILVKYSKIYKKKMGVKRIEIQQIERVIENGKVKKDSTFLHTQTINHKIGLKLSFITIITKARRMNIDNGKVLMRRKFIRRNSEEKGSVF